MIDVSESLNKIADVLELATHNPRQAAAELEAWAKQLLELSFKLRSLSGGLPQDDSGIGDRVMMKSVGPDGKIKQYTDTARRPCPTCGSINGVI